MNSISVLGTETPVQGFNPFHYPGIIVLERPLTPALVAGFLRLFWFPLPVLIPPAAPHSLIIRSYDDL
jgi:hypothetical protein